MLWAAPTPLRPAAVDALAAALAGAVAVPGLAAAPGAPRAHAALRAARQVMVLRGAVQGLGHGPV